MPLPNPWYIDAEARHLAPQQRLLAFSAVEGQEGILAAEHLAVTDLDTPGGAINVAPGGYSVLARHLGGSFEAYVGKITAQEQVTVNPTDSTGGRTDLVILRVENPYVSGSGVWAQPADPLNGPYAHVRVIEGVPANTTHVSAVNATWSAITLARITRPASTGIVQQSHITDLRSLARLGEQRIIIIDNPPATPPPIAQQYWTESTPIGNGDELLSTETVFTDFPNQATWQVPVPVWAKGMDVNVLLNPTVTDDVIGEFRLVVQGEPTGAIPTVFNVNMPTGIGNIRDVMMVGGTESLKPSWCGRVSTMKLQARSTSSTHPGLLRCDPGTRVNIWLSFKRFPVYSDGGV